MRKILIADGKPIIKLDPHTHVCRKVNFALTFADILQPKLLSQMSHTATAHPNVAIQFQLKGAGGGGEAGPGEQPAVGCPFCLAFQLLRWHYTSLINFIQMTSKTTKM